MTCVYDVFAKLIVLPPFIFTKAGYSGMRAGSHRLSQEGEPVACWSKHYTKMSQSEEEYEYGHQTEDEEHSEEEEVFLEELEEEADENEKEAPYHVTSWEDLEEEHNEEDLDAMLKT